MLTSISNSPTLPRYSFYHYSLIRGVHIHLQLPKSTVRLSLKRSFSKETLKETKGWGVEDMGEGGWEPRPSNDPRNHTERPESHL